jgi:hypothetical protein
MQVSKTLISFSSFFRGLILGIEFSYCIWCGCQYESLEELNQECPGEEEDDH